MVVVVSANHPLLQVAQPKEGRTYPCVSIEQLRCYSFAVSEPQNRSYILAKKYFDDHEWMPQIVCQVPYTGYLYNVVANGNCIALVPNIPLDAIDGEPNVRYLCLEDACQLSTLAVIRSRDYILTTYDKELINNIRKQFRHNSLVL